MSDLSSTRRLLAAALVAASAGLAAAARAPETPATRLKMAAFNGDYNQVLYYLNQGVSPNVIAWGDTPLGAAASTGQANIVQLLLDRGAWVNQRTGNGGTAIGAAAVSANYGIIQLLISRGADLNSMIGALNTARMYRGRGQNPQAYESCMSLLQDAIARAQAAAAAAENQRRLAEDPPVLVKYLSGHGLSSGRRKELAKGDLVWDEDAPSPSRKARRAAEELQRAGWKQGFDAVGDLASTGLQAELADSVGQKPQEPAPLTQGSYEGRLHFTQRAEKAKDEFAKVMAAYGKKMAQARAKAETDEAEWLAKSFFLVMGEPKISATQYDPDKQLFSVTVTAAGELSGGYVFHLVLKDPVANDAAEKFDKKLRKAGPAVRFALKDGSFTVQDAELKVSGKKWQALPSAEGLQPSLASVDFGPLARELAVSQAAPTLSAELTGNAELDAKLKELQDLRSKKAQEGAIAKLEEQIDALRKSGQKTYRSDVDEPDFKKAERPEDFALVVGIEDYQQNLPPAQFAGRDAEAVRRHLEALGVPEKNVLYLAGPQATRSRIEGFLREWLPKNLGPESRLYVYFAGHGAPDAQSKSAYLLPWDGDPSLLKTSAISLSDFYRELDALPAKQIVVMLDACFSGMGSRSVAMAGARGLVVVIENYAPPQDKIALFAAAGAEQIAGSDDEQGHGLFTYYLLKGLDAKPKDARQLYEFLKPRVEKQAARKNQVQNPVFSGVDVEF